MNWLIKNAVRIFDYFCIILAKISPELNNRFIYFCFNRRALNLSHPVTLNEKLIKLRLKKYNSDPVVKQCADKYGVRSYLESHGCGEILIPLIASYDNVEDIEWDKLPNEFAMKWSFGCGMNIICPNKTKLDIPKTIEKLKKWKNNKDYLKKAEMQYEGYPKKIVVEEYIKPQSGIMPPDFKVYCFNGVAKCIFYITDRGTDHKVSAFFDREWNYISEPINMHKDYNHVTNLPPRPVNLKKMLGYAEKLSSAFPFVRVDFYEVDGKLYFGEMTFTPASGLFVSECLLDGKPMGEYLSIGIGV